MTPQFFLLSESREALMEDNVFFATDGIDMRCVHIHISQRDMRKNSISLHVLGVIHLPTFQSIRPATWPSFEEPPISPQRQALDRLYA